MIMTTIVTAQRQLAEIPAVNGVLVSPLHQPSPELHVHPQSDLLLLGGQESTQAQAHDCNTTLFAAACLSSEAVSLPEEGCMVEEQPAIRGGLVE